VALNEVSPRPAAKADADFVYTLTEACMREYVERTWGQWSEDMARAAFKPVLSQIVQCDGEDVGCIELTEKLSDLNLGEFYIAPSLQNCGIGSALMQQFISRARGSGQNPRANQISRHSDGDC
jgi:GNAT superfamily N-acetyltransferase